MRRTELIPQTTAAINAGTVYYHFSMKRSATNPPSIYREHQDQLLRISFHGDEGRWDVGGVTKWSVNWDADVWHNVAYAINFSAGTVAFYHSTGSDPLTLTVAAVTASTYSNGADWHLSVLELPVSGQPDGIEDYFFSGVYIEAGSITTSVAGPGGIVVLPSLPTTTTTTTPKITSKAISSTNSSKAASTTMSTIAATSSAASCSRTVARWGQCGGQNYNGSTTCVAGTTCTVLNAWCYQCL